MNKLRFLKDEGTAFYKELRQQLDQYFEAGKTERDRQCNNEREGYSFFWNEHGPGIRCSRK